MPTFIVIITFAFVLPLSTGCRRPSRPATQPAMTVSTIAPSFERLVGDRGSVTFRSWNGQALGMDNDTELTFYPDHSIHMFEWGYGLASYRGTYDVHENGRIVARFEEFGQEWPVMVVYRQDGTFMLRPWDANVHFVMGNRGGATIPGGMGSYWPFRMLTGDDEKQVLDRIRAQAERPPS